MPLQEMQAAFVTNENARGRTRRELRLQIEGQTPAGAVGVLIHNISQTGILIETAAKLDANEAIDLDLPEVGRREATVVWSRQNFHGCVFLEAISTAGVSAALLRSPPETIAASELLELNEPENAPIADAAPQPPELSLQAKAWIIAGLAVVAWVFVGLALFAMAR